MTEAMPRRPRWNEDAKVGDRVRQDSNNAGIITAVVADDFTVRWDNGVWDDTCHWKGDSSIQRVQ